ncbi:phage holin family protein [Oceanidesulfovibrio marinus]|uniref:Phage holin family protein n=1 Tax=Oceanidesulfovibrio marinus TaxID=370038 RepID=A0A6P1ZLX7_9BACT|nr:phage holin family protein [Oceanidesulfovibrio marinus]QJT08163.1 phage holin family protein [Oceanidesulfovibrio marinus]TVM35058.1 phage holin family protein [Oceanidesulfovibrio marinus]
MPGPFESALSSILEAPEHARRAVRIILALGRNRLELVGVEAREESLLLLRLLILAAAAFLFLALAVVVGTFTVIYAVGPEHRLTALVCATALFAIIGVILVLVTRMKVRNAKPPFSQTVAELRKDEDCL